MRLPLFALCALVSGLAPTAQPVQPSPPVAEGYALLVVSSESLPPEAAQHVPLDPSRRSDDLAVGALASGLGATGGLIGGAVIVTGLYVFDDCSAFGCSQDSAVRGLYAPGWIAGGAVGTVATVWLLGRDDNPAVRRDDWKRALVGVGVGTLAGAALMATVPGVRDPDGPLWPVLAVPVLQGVGAGVAVGLRP